MSASGELSLDLFQLDDGWQSAWGDWLRPNAKFPSLGYNTIEVHAPSQKQRHGATKLYKGHGPALFFSGFDVLESNAELLMLLGSWLSTSPKICLQAFHGFHSVCIRLLLVLVITVC